MNPIYSRQELIDQMPLRMGTKGIYRLRWQFHFIDGTVKTGVWNGSTNRFTDTAASINKTGLRMARIQSEDFHGYGIRSVFECDGHDYVTSKWIGAGSANLGQALAMIRAKPRVISPQVVGLMFQTRTEAVTVFIDGSVSRRTYRKDEKIDNIREHKTEV